MAEVVTCIVVMRWIVVATVRVKHDLTVEQLCSTVRRPQRHTVRQSSGDSARSSRDAGRGQSQSTVCSSTSTYTSSTSRPTSKLYSSTSTKYYIYGLYMC